jgi:transcriptional regulator with XRE-family HTH domain
MATNTERAGGERTVTPQTTADRVRGLRRALAVTQERLAEMCGLERVEVVQLEAGKNKATSYATRAALARGTDVPIDAMAAYLDGEIALPSLLALQGSYASTQWWRPPS